MGVRAPAKDGDIVERMVILVIQHPSKLHVLAIHGMSCSESTLVPISHNLPFLHALCNTHDLCKPKGPGVSIKASDIAFSSLPQEFSAAN